MYLCSQNVVFEVKRVLEKTVRTLKVLGESGTASASRSHHPLVAILCVVMAWLVNCLHGGDGATQFWGMAGVDQLILAHYKVNSLPFVKVKDSNIMNEIFRKGQRVAQEDPCKWSVFTSGSPYCTSHRTGKRNISPFSLMFEEIIFVASNRSDYGKVSHVIDLARDITQLNGTINEQVQVILYAKSLFLDYAATSGIVRFIVFTPVCREIWHWVETGWRNVACHSSSNVINTNNKGVNSKLSRAQGDVVTAGFSFLHSIISHASVALEDIVELTTFNTGDSEEAVNVLHELVGWILKLRPGVVRHNGSTINVLVENGVALITNFVQVRGYDEVAFATLTNSVDIGYVLELLGMESTFETSEGKTIVTIDEKQRLWSMLLYFDNKIIASRIVETGFLNIGIVSRLLVQNSNGFTDVAMDILNRRLEAVVLLEVLICSGFRRENSIATQMIFTEACKLVLHHGIIAKEAAIVRNSNSKQVAVSKRVLQLVCCMCIDFSSQSPSSAFLTQLESIGIPTWIVDFHQNHETNSSNNDELLTRVEQFWKDWEGHGVSETKYATTMLHNKSEKNIVQTTRRAVSQTGRHKLAQKGLSGKVEIMEMDDAAEVMVSVSPVKIAPKPRQPSHSNVPKSPSVIQTFLSIDSDSALRLVKKANATKAGKKQLKNEIEEEELDSEAYSPFPGTSSSDEDTRADRKANTKLNFSKGKKSIDAKENEKETKHDNTSSRTRDSEDCESDRDRPRRKLRKNRKARKIGNRPSVSPNSDHEVLRGIFRKYDVDGDGAISFIDLRRAMDQQMTGHRLSDLEIQRWITEKDRSGQGVVNYEDFVVAFQAQVEQ
ncbi:Calmodulin-like myosin-light chain [Phytophthora megakarya]|uniref:Calmodulin-like myosin-light chain n=1 Tax=Phytophthora megakarya TaxID=4795 RepID=A0A225WVP2_9STRA|nr:Calmodulin-like myosin-light chain [Phytophthora megakarya]